MNKKLSILLVASFFAAILNANNVSAAKYTVENVENNPQYRFLSQRLVRLEIDEDEEIDFEELAKNIFVPSKTKCPVAKAWNGLNTETAQYAIINANIEEGIYHHNDPMSLYGKIKELQKDPSFRSGKIDALLQFIGHYPNFGNNLGLEEDIIDFSIIYSAEHHHLINYNNIPIDGYLRFLVEKKSPEIDKYTDKMYADLFIYNQSPGTAIGPSCSSLPVYIYENFELIIKRKSDPVDEPELPEENPSSDNQDEQKEETLQEIQENSPTTESASIPIQAPNTGHSTNFAPLIAVAILTTTTGLFFIKKR